MTRAIQECFRKYATFSGRSTRSEYWFFYLFCFIVVYVADYFTPGSFANLIDLVLFLPLLAAGVRRMHDITKSGWFLLIPIYSLILLCMPSEDNNKYGARRSLFM